MYTDVPDITVSVPIPNPRPIPRTRSDNRFSVVNMAAPINADRETEEQKNFKKELSDQYVTIKRQILQFQSETLGLFPRLGKLKDCPRESHVRDSIYCAVAAWALSQAYRRLDDDMGRTHELKQAAVKCMRGILFCWIRQADKVEKFKDNQSPGHALHSVFDMYTGDPVYKDTEYEHLQIDVVGLYLIFLVQMTTSGLQIIFTTDEVNFVQNLVFYVERAYRTPDYGMWERGSKYNNDSTEIHASSIGLAKAALEAINGVNLFGDQGASWSVIFVDIDAHNRNRTIFESILPRESNSKNTDAALLATVAWPAFGIHEEPFRSLAIEKVIRKLQGQYGIRRYIRDGYKTVLEDKSRKYYKPAEIKKFDGIECEWPMFFVYMLIENVFKADKEGVQMYSDMLKKVMYKSPDGLLLPQYFFIPQTDIEMERINPGVGRRIPSPEGTTDGIFLWGQAIYFISQLLVNNLLNINELDPIRRHLPASERPKTNSRYSSFQITPPDLVIQVVPIAESPRLQQLLATYGIQTQTPHQIEPIQIWSPKELSKAYEYLGLNKKMGLSGRPKRPFGVLSTSKIYRACGETVLCYPLLFEMTDFYMAQDVSIVIDDLKSDMAFLSKCWKLSGRPTFCMLIRENNIRGPNFGEYLDLLAQIKSGNVDGIRVRMGRLQTLISSACVEHLDFLSTLPDGFNFVSLEEVTHMGSSFKSLTDIPAVEELADEEILDEQEIKQKATWDLINIYKCTDSLTAKSQVLKILMFREGASFHVDGTPITKRLEMLVNEAGLHKKWDVVRLCSALLGKLVDSLAPSITSILVRGKHLTVGVFGHEEEVLDKPVSPNEIKTILYSKCVPYDICQAVLQQELILYIGKHIATSPQVYDGILKIRIGWFVRAMEMELEQDGIKVASLSPYQVKQVLMSVLLSQKEEPIYRSPLQQRQLDGALSRVPKDFYARVWEILERSPCGIKVAGYLLPQQPTLSDMTLQELNFSLLVEQMLSKIVDPAYRQIMVETFMVVSTLLQRNPELVFHQSVQMDKMIQEAFDEFQRDRNRLEGHEKQDDMRAFYNTQPNVKNGTTSYLVKAVVKTVLDGDIKVNTDDMCCIS